MVTLDRSLDVVDGSGRGGSMSSETSMPSDGSSGVVPGGGVGSVVTGSVFDLVVPSSALHLELSRQNNGEFLIKGVSERSPLRHVLKCGDSIQKVNGIPAPDWRSLDDLNEELRKQQGLGQRMFTIYRASENIFNCSMPCGELGFDLVRHDDGKIFVQSFKPSSRVKNMVKTGDEIMQLNGRPVREWASTFSFASFVQRLQYQMRILTIRRVGECELPSPPPPPSPPPNPPTERAIQIRDDEKAAMVESVEGSSKAGILEGVPIIEVRDNESTTAAIVQFTVYVPPGPLGLKMSHVHQTRQFHVKAVNDPSPTGGKVLPGDELLQIGERYVHQFDSCPDLNAYLKGLPVADRNLSFLRIRENSPTDTTSDIDTTIDTTIQPHISSPNSHEQEKKSQESKPDEHHMTRQETHAKDDETATHDFKHEQKLSDEKSAVVVAVADTDADADADAEHPTEKTPPDVNATKGEAQCDAAPNHESAASTLSRSEHMEGTMPHKANSKTDGPESNAGKIQMGSTPAPSQGSPPKQPPGKSTSKEADLAHDETQTNAKIQGFEPDTQDDTHRQNGRSQELSAATDEKETGTRKKAQKIQGAALMSQDSPEETKGHKNVPQEVLGEAKVGAAAETQLSAVVVQGSANQHDENLRLGVVATTDETEPKSTKTQGTVTVTQDSTTEEPQRTLQEAIDTIDTIDTTHNTATNATNTNEPVNVPQKSLKESPNGTTTATEVSATKQSGRPDQGPMEVDDTTALNAAAEEIAGTSTGDTQNPAAVASPRLGASESPIFIDVQETGKERKQKHSAEYVDLTSSPDDIIDQPAPAPPSDGVGKDATRTTVADSSMETEQSPKHYQDSEMPNETQNLAKMDGRPENGTKQAAPVSSRESSQSSKNDAKSQSTQKHHIALSDAANESSMNSSKESSKGENNQFSRSNQIPNGRSVPSETATTQTRQSLTAVEPARHQNEETKSAENKPCAESGRVILQDETLRGAGNKPPSGTDRVHQKDGTLPTSKNMVPNGVLKKQVQSVSQPNAHSILPRTQERSNSVGKVEVPADPTEGGATPTSLDNGLYTICIEKGGPVGLSIRQDNCTKVVKVSAVLNKEKTKGKVQVGDELVQVDGLKAQIFHGTVAIRNYLTSTSPEVRTLTLKRAGAASNATSSTVSSVSLDGARTAAENKPTDKGKAQQHTNGPLICQKGDGDKTNRTKQLDNVSTRKVGDASDLKKGLVDETKAITIDTTGTKETGDVLRNQNGKRTGTKDDAVNSSKRRRTVERAGEAILLKSKLESLGPPSGEVHRLYVKEAFVHAAVLSVSVEKLRHFLDDAQVCRNTVLKTRLENLMRSMEDDIARVIDCPTQLLTPWEQRIRLMVKFGIDAGTLALEGLDKVTALANDMGVHHRDAIWTKFLEQTILLEQRLQQGRGGSADASTQITDESHC